MRYIIVYTILLVMTITIKFNNSEKILAVAFISTKSHKIVYEPLLHELAKKGHEITILTPIVGENNKNKNNIREILTRNFEDEAKEYMPNMFQMKESGIETNPFLLWDLFGQLCYDTYDLPHVRELMKEKFDLIIVQPHLNDCVMGFIHHFKTNFMFIIPIGAPPMFTTFTGLPTLPSFIPNLFLPFTDKMTYGQRMKNFVTDVALNFIIEWYWKPKMEEIYREKLGDQNIPGVNEIMRNVSFILSNTHFSLNPPKPYLPDTVDVGGMHCRPTKPLPKDLDKFLNSSGTDGFIYFSFGSLIPAHTMSEKYRMLFLNTFAKLKQKVIWKWETEEMLDLPKNVKLGKWLPQQDILGHPNIRMFITHGGFGGTTEAVYHGVPLLGIPMFDDQLLNLQQAEHSGFGINLEFNKLSEEKLLAGINRILENKSFHERAKNLSNVFRDQPNKPLDRAVFWTEYVIRHKGAVHMRSAGRDLNFFQYHSIDVIASYIGILLLILYVIIALFKFLFRKMCRSSKNSIGTEKKRN